MATTVYETVEISLSDGKVVELRPLTIKNLKKFMQIIEKLNGKNIKTESDAMDVFVEAAFICMQQFAPDLFADKDAFEDVIEVPTLMKILEVGGGIRMNDPNLLTANLDGEI